MLYVAYLLLEKRLNSNYKAALISEKDLSYLTNTPMPLPEAVRVEISNQPVVVCTRFPGTQLYKISKANAYEYQ